MDPATSCCQAEAGGSSTAAAPGPNPGTHNQAAAALHPSAEMNSVVRREGSSTSRASTSSEHPQDPPEASPSSTAEATCPPKSLSSVSQDVAVSSPCPHDPELLLSLEHVHAFDIIAPAGSGRPKQAPCDLESDPAAAGAEQCWICMCGVEEGELLHPCNCPSMYSHQMCLVRWQMRQHGRDEELMCRFCKAPLPRWEDTLLELRNKRAAALAPTSRRSMYYALACLICTVCTIILTVTFCFLKYTRRI